MMTKIVAITIIFVFTVLIIVTVGILFFLRKSGLLSLLLKHQWPLGILSGLFLIQFIVNAIALLANADWAVPAMRYTIYFWLAYVWLYGLRDIFGRIALLRGETPKNVSQLMGRSNFFDQVVNKSIALSKESTAQTTEASENAHAVSDSSFEDLLNDEEMFKELFPFAMRRKIKRKAIGLLVHTVFFVLILLFMR